MTHFKKTALSLGLCAVLGLSLAGCSNTWHGMKSDWHGVKNSMTPAKQDATTTTTTSTTTTTTTTTQPVQIVPNNTPVYN